MRRSASRMKRITSAGIGSSRTATDRVSEVASVAAKSESGQDLLHDVAVNVGEPVVAAGVAERQLLVVESHQVEDRRVQVVDVDLVLDRVPAELVGLAVA